MEMADYDTENVAGTAVIVFPRVDGDNIIVASLLIACLQVTFLILTSIRVLAHIYQASTGISVASTALLTFYLSKRPDWLGILVNVFVLTWSLRLSTFLLIRSCSYPYRNFSLPIQDSGLMRRIGFWIFQICWVLGLSFPVILINSPHRSYIALFTLASPESIFEDRRLHIALEAGILILGFMIESIADIQKLCFRRLSPYALCDTGLWGFSRHPNYFGEILEWSGLFFLCLPSVLHLPGGEWKWALALISPLVLVTSVLFYSGLPLAEKQLSRRFSANKVYHEYIDRTSPLLPLPQCLYAKFPRSIKVALCCEISPGFSCFSSKSRHRSHHDHESATTLNLHPPLASKQLYKCNLLNKLTNFSDLQVASPKVHCEVDVNPTDGICPARDNSHTCENNSRTTQASLPSLND